MPMRRAISFLKISAVRRTRSTLLGVEWSYPINKYSNFTLAEFRSLRCFWYRSVEPHWIGPVSYTHLTLPTNREV